MAKVQEREQDASGGLMGTIRNGVTFVEESYVELQKVTWPDWEQLKSATLVVIVFVLLVSATIWTMDIIVRTLVNGIMAIFGA